MRFLYALIAMVLWEILMIPVQGISIDTLCLSFAIVIAGALAGGDGK